VLIYSFGKYTKIALVQREAAGFPCNPNVYSGHTESDIDDMITQKAARINPVDGPTKITESLLLSQFLRLVDLPKSGGVICCALGGHRTDFLCAIRPVIS
jgi:hypothetical protein